MHIIAGKFKNLRLDYPKKIRPTSQKVREAVFDILGDIEGYSVLDLYAGSGAYGIESLSRGAGSAAFVDLSKGSVASVRANLARAKSFAKVYKIDAIIFLKRNKLKFDLIFLDPPYEDQSLELIDMTSSAIKPGGTLVAEAPKKMDLTDTGSMKLVDRRVYGDTLVGFYRKLK